MEIKIETPPQCPGRHEYQLWHRSSWMDTYKEGPSAKGPFQSPSLKPPLKPFVKAPCCLFCFTCLHNAFMHVDMYTCFIMFPAPLRWLKTTAIPRRKRVQLFFCPSPLPFGGSTVLSLTHGPAGNRTTTGSLSAPQE